MIKKYPDINRTGCAMLYVAQKSQGDARTEYLQSCIEKFNDCFYADDVHVGVYARFLLAANRKKPPPYTAISQPNTPMPSITAKIASWTKSRAINRSEPMQRCLV
jgi:hypothetical protein